MKKKSMAIVALATGLLLFNAFTSFAGWEDVGGGWGTDIVYRNDNTGHLVTGWNELPWKDGVAWFYFGDDNLLYQFRETPDGYIVDSDGVWYEADKDYEYNWSTEREFTTEAGSTICFMNSHFASEFFTDFSGEMNLNEFKEYVENKGAKILTCSQTSKKGHPYILEGKEFHPTDYFTDFSFNYKGLKFRINVQDFTDKIGTGAQIMVIGKAE